ncbi:hypothetical protein SM124_15405 [Bacillus sp. 31A1R]|uniref:YfjL-like N-terminal domain-containing protein n=1 Tax=Robertmurraya mangrovi TaxID=3098077 RepID=A0ABU5J110_9BACI|nr:hypothetical protein [Bacillus sp. 31A1R]MDZ5473105.1 hypothetical protein [Bacillus sp. 31A1R]
MKKSSLIILSICILLIGLYYGYSTIRTLNGNPIAMPRAKNLVIEYINLAYPNDDFQIGKGTYAVTYGNYYFDVEDSKGIKVNELLVPKNLTLIEDTMQTDALNEKVADYLATHTTIETIEVNGTVSFAKEMNKSETIWVTVSGNNLSKEKLADFGQSIYEWSKNHAPSLNKLIVDATNVSNNESYRLSLDKKQLTESNYIKFIE